MTKLRRCLLSSTSRLLLAVCVIGCSEAPPPPLRIAPDTTLITEPIADDGYPDFARAFVDRQREGVTPENNGAIPFWQAIGPAEIDPEYREMLFSEIGCPVPEAEGVLTSFRDELDNSEFREALAGGLGVSIENDRIEKVVDRIDTMSQQRVWRGRDSAILTRWVDANSKPLALLREAAARPKFFSPPANLLTAPPDPLIAALLPDAQELRRVFRALCTEAVHQLGVNDLDGAWDDIKAALSLTERYELRDTLVEQLISIRGKELAYEATTSWLGLASEETMVRSSLERLSRAPESHGVQRALAFGESLMQIDSFLGSFIPERPGADRRLFKNRHRVDMNVVLSYCRAWQIRAAEVALIADRTERRRSVADFESTLDSEMEAAAAQSGAFAGRLSMYLSREERSKAVGQMFVANLFPAVGKAIAAEDRCVARHRMTVLAAALRLHRLGSDSYPDTLDALTPDPLAELPLDPFSGEPFRYQRRGDGFVLWSVGENGVDDSANDPDGDFVDGEYAPIDWFGERDKPEGVDDLVVRLPVPELRLPDTFESPE